MRLSIITINYNNAIGLEKTIRSVVSQNYKDFEFIVIDGGSTDQSRSIIESNEQDINYWVSEPDSGIYNAMNKGIAIAKGDFLLFLNSGDYLASQDVLFDIFDNADYRVSIIRGNQLCDYKTHIEKWINFGPREVTLFDLYTSSLHHQATFFKRELFEKYGNYDESLKIVSDWQFSIKAILGNEKSIYVDVDVVVYDYGGLSSNPVNKDLVKSERDLTLKTLLPLCILADYENLKKIKEEARSNQYYYNMVNFIVAHRFPLFIFRIISKLYYITGRSR